MYTFTKTLKKNTMRKKITGKKQSGHRVQKETEERDATGPHGARHKLNL